LSEKLPGGRCFYYGLFEGENQIGFQCFANYTPKKKGMPWIYHSNRVVIHPDYQGLGLGQRLVDACSALMLRENPTYKIMAKFSSVPMFKSRQGSKYWKLTKVHRKMGKEIPGGNMLRQSGFRDGGVTAFSFKFVAKAKDILG